MAKHGHIAFKPIRGNTGCKTYSNYCDPSSNAELEGVMTARCADFLCENMVKGIWMISPT